MTVRIDQMTHLPPAADGSTAAGAAASSPSAKSLGQVQVLAAIRRDTARRERLWAD